ncbi:dickkopf-related 3 [Pelobates cultripes]|uniref:Dickkopf-related 3 n=1 Tax=Pelobates cultripes TaxID=61616 RepID=A0AAD1TF37_PELCU|nr:dickkopf-related 3 [Pelobates cultripes]
MSSLILFVLPLLLGTVAPSPARWAPDGEDVLMEVDVSPMEPAFNVGAEKDSLNEMFREVEELMEDSQTKLQNAVREMEAEDLSAARLPIVNMKDLPPNYHNESITDTKIGNKTVHTEQQILKATDNQTGSTFYAESIFSSVRNKKNYDCIVDDDCQNRTYCHFEKSQYKCLPCRNEGTCMRDGECCDGQLCVWGQCTMSTKGASGTICESQQDCSAGLCCSIQSSLLYPVCAPLPVKGELCHNPVHQLLNVLSWNLQSDGVLDLCPCSSGLVCQSQSHTLVSVCEELPQDIDRRANPEALIEDFPFVSLLPQEELNYEDSYSVTTGSSPTADYRMPEMYPDINQDEI